MFRDPKDASTKLITIAFKWGGLGDNIARWPALKYILNNFPNNYYALFVPVYFKELLEKFLELDPPKAKYTVAPLDVYFKNQNRFQIVIDFTPETFTAMRMKLTDVAFIHINDRLPTREESTYPDLAPAMPSFQDLQTKFNLPDKYVVVTSLFTAPAREWPANEVMRVVNGVISRGYCPVFLGKSKIECMNNVNIKGYSPAVDFSLGLDLRDKTSLLDAAAIMHYSKATMGIDNGLLHLGACTHAPLIWGFTSVAPEARVPVRPLGNAAIDLTILPDENLACKFCQTNINWEMEHEFTKCFYKDYLCTKQMTAEKFLRALDQILPVP